jgi:uncharacterized membrane protein YbhN (UPF0104 family)
MILFLFEIKSFVFFFEDSERPAVLTITKGHYISSRLPDEIIITIACVIGILLFAFIFFLIYHFRNEKTLRQTLLATRILATRGINNLKSVSKLDENINYKIFSINRINFIEMILIQKRKNL